MANLGLATYTTVWQVGGKGLGNRGANEGGGNHEVLHLVGWMEGECESRWKMG